MRDIAGHRLVNQQIEATGFTTPQQLVYWMGAMQAQDYNMAKWAIGSRIRSMTDAAVEQAINCGEIIRTHIMRPTWHFVAAEDIYWMLDLTANRIKASLKSRHKQLELTDKILNKGLSVIEKALLGEVHLTRAELLSELVNAKIMMNTERGSHLLLLAELEGLICSGSKKENQLTYALLNERVPKKVLLNKEEALARLAEKYFNSHGPATLQDFVWWSGLQVREAKFAMELIKDKFQAFEFNAQVYWHANKSIISVKTWRSAILLPAFDEFIISYKDRSAALTFDDHRKTVSINGIFRPIIICDGKVQGIWKKSVKKDHVKVEVQFFSDQWLQNDERSKLIEAAESYGYFLKRKVELKFAPMTAPGS